MSIQIFTSKIILTLNAKRWTKAILQQHNYSWYYFKQQESLGYVWMLSPLYSMCRKCCVLYLTSNICFWLIKYFGAMSRDSWIKITDLSGIISVPIIRVWRDIVFMQPTRPKNFILNLAALKASDHAYIARVVRGRNILQTYISSVYISLMQMAKNGTIIFIIFAIDKLIL
jgi:hypothetical protein